MRLLLKFARRERRVVLDTNVLISATLVHLGMPARIVIAALDGRITLIVSDNLLTEYLNVIQRPHITKKYRELATRIQRISIFLRHDTIRVDGTPTKRVVLDDPKDDFIIAGAIEGKAHYIVSGDEHLLQLGKYRGIKILTPRDFVVNVLGETIR